MDGFQSARALYWFSSLPLQLIVAALTGSHVFGSSAEAVTGKRDVYSRLANDIWSRDGGGGAESATRLHSYTIGLKFVTSRSTAYSDPDYSST